MNKRLLLLKNLLGTTAFWQINKHLAKSIGHLPTLLLAHLVDIETNYENMPEEFYQQYDRLSESTGLSKHQIGECIRILKETDLIQVKKKGIPAKNHYILNVDNILNALVEGPETCVAKIATQVGQKLPHKYRETIKTEKQEVSSAEAGGSFTNPSYQAAEHELVSLANWDKLTSIWKTAESSGVLKGIFKKYFLPLGQQDQEQILNMVQEFGSDVQYLSNTWIGKTFKEGLMNRESLQKDITKRKSFSKNRNEKLADDIKSISKF